MSKNALILVGEWRSYNLFKYKFESIIKSNNCDVYAVITNYSKQIIDLSLIHNLKNIKIYTKEELDSCLSNIPNYSVSFMELIKNYKSKTGSTYNGRPEEFYNNLDNNFFKNQFT